jgi:hypothetical protein
MDSLRGLYVCASKFVLVHICRFLDQNVNISIEEDAFAPLISLQTLYERIGY